MVILFLLYVLSIFHILFFIKYFFFEFERQEFYGFVIEYQFSRDIALESFLFALSSIVALWIGYCVSYRKASRKSASRFCKVNDREITRAKYIVIMFAVILSAYIAWVFFAAGGNYHNMTLARESSGFIFELRYILLMALSFIFLNKSPFDLLKATEFKSLRIILIIYTTMLIVFGARSPLFELLLVVIYSYCMWGDDKIKIRYVLIMGILSIAPNLLILNRLGTFPDKFSDLLSSIFSFEYTILINNIFSAALFNKDVVASGFTFANSMLLIIPSPIRNLFEIEIFKSEYYQIISDDALSRGGGFSMFAELYSNFYWYAPLIMLLIGLLLGRFSFMTRKVGSVSVFYALGPIVFGAFILALRNDLGPFIKIFVQLLVLVPILRFLLKLKS